jgi:hypothetical protein
MFWRTLASSRAAIYAPRRSSGTTVKGYPSAEDNHWCFAIDRASEQHVLLKKHKSRRHRSSDLAGRLRRRLAENGQAEPESRGMSV